MLRKQKENIVTELHEYIKDSRLVVLSSFTGLNVEKMTDLRKSLQEVESTYRVVKNTLIKKAAQGTNLESIKGSFVGSSAVIFTKGEPTRPCKIIKEFKKENEQIKIKGGVLEGKALSEKDIDELANLPSREVLLAKLLFFLRAPQQRLVNVFSGVSQRLVRVLEAIRKKRES